MSGSFLESEAPAPEPPRERKGLMFAVLLLLMGVAGVLVWLLATYFLHVVGEMCLSPVGLSTVTKLAPSRVAASHVIGQQPEDRAIERLRQWILAKSSAETRPSPFPSTWATKSVKIARS